MALVEYQGKRPVLGPGAIVAASADVIGAVELGAGASVWHGCVIRGDDEAIRIGAASNVQELTMIHAGLGPRPTTLGRGVTVGPRSVLHGCDIGDDVLIGAGAVVLDNAVVESGAVIAAGAVVSPGKRVPGGEVWAGVPAQKLRAVTQADHAAIRDSASRHMALAAHHRTKP